MTDALRIVGIGGSYSDDSTSLAALRVALAGAARAGAVVEIFDVKDLDLPLWGSVEDVPPAARRLADAVAAADGLVWSTPLYHGTLSGAMKNALDWLQLLADHEPAYITDKPVGLISAAGGVQGLQAINAMENVVRALRGWTVPLVVPVARSWQAFGDGGEPRDAKVEEALQGLGAEVARAARRFHPAPAIA